MIRARLSSDRYAQLAHRILDRCRDQGIGSVHIAWALAYLGDAPGQTKIPDSLHGGNRKKGNVMNQPHRPRAFAGGRHAV